MSKFDVSGHGEEPFVEGINVNDLASKNENSRGKRVEEKFMDCQILPGHMRYLI